MLAMPHSPPLRLLRATNDPLPPDIRQGLAQALASSIFDTLLRQTVPVDYSWGYFHCGDPRGNVRRPPNLQQRATLVLLFDLLLDLLRSSNPRRAQVLQR
jgi:hypothetical protein